MPGPEVTEEGMAGKVALGGALGGCVVFPEAPDRLCRNRHHKRRADGARS